MQSFDLAPRLAADCSFVLDWPLCRVLLMRDAHYPWFVLVPRLPALRELCQLNETDDTRYRQESRWLSRWLLDELKADKLNIAALGNIEPQLHIHHIARYYGDAAWPAPVWGAHTALAYSDAALNQFVQRSREALSQHL